MKSTTNANWSYELTPAKKQKNRFAPFPRWQERRTRALCKHSARVFCISKSIRFCSINLRRHGGWARLQKRNALVRGIRLSTICMERTQPKPLWVSPAPGAIMCISFAASRCSSSVCSR